MAGKPKRIEISVKTNANDRKSITAAKVKKAVRDMLNADPTALASPVKDGDIFITVDRRR